MSGTRMAVGFGDMVRFGVGAAVPLLMLVSALVIAGFVAAGADVGNGITLAFTLALVLAIALEMFRRYVLASRESGGQAATRWFRGLLWAVVIGAVPVTAVLGLGVSTACYGQTCDDLPGSCSVSCSRAACAPCRWLCWAVSC